MYEIYVTSTNSSKAIFWLLNMLFTVYCQDVGNKNLVHAPNFAKFRTFKKGNEI
jgi:hypothetical protein